MKRSIRSVINSVACTVINSAVGTFQNLTLADGEVEKRYRLSPYGTFPATLPDGRVIQQVVDQEAAQLLISNHGSFGAKIESLFRGIPIYEGHADDAMWLKNNPGHKTSAVGRIKKIEAGDDGIYVNSVFNSDGTAMLGGEAPKYSGHSPRWRMKEIEGRPGHYRPAFLWSDALTNYPNIEGNTIALNALDPDSQPSPTEKADAESEPENETKMKLNPDLLKRLGFAPDATPTDDEVSAAIIKALDAKKTEEAPSEAVTAANSKELTDLRTQLTQLLGTAVATKVDAAVASGRITAADKAKWVDALNADFDGESKKLEKLMPTISTGAAPDLSARRSEVDVANAAGSITDAVSAYAKANGIDVGTRAGYDRAFAGARTERPELFKR